MKDNQEHEKNDRYNNDLQAYLKDMENLESDFSDLEDLDLEEIKEMQEAIAEVKAAEKISTKELSTDKRVDKEIDISIKEELDYLEQKEALINDFSDLDEIDFDELKEMKEAIEIVAQKEQHASSKKEVEFKQTQKISRELKQRIKHELLKRKEIEEETIITAEKFLDYVKNKRNKVWYHALYYLVFKVEDHIASKFLLYDVLKEATSKSAIDPIPEHQFYFGLGYILRLSLNNKRIIRYMRDGKFKVNVDVKNLKKILEKAGEPIKTKPTIAIEEKKKMFRDFLKEDFKDI